MKGTVIRHAGIGFIRWGAHVQLGTTMPSRAVPFDVTVVVCARRDGADVVN